MRHRHLILLSAIALYVIMLVVTWTATTRSAKRQTESMLDFAVTDLTSTVEGAIDTLMMHLAEAVINVVKKPQAFPQERMAQMLAKSDIDELNIIDRNGTILASSDERLVGVSMTGQVPPTLMYAENMSESRSQTAMASCRLA